MSSEQASSTYLERQIQGMSSVRLPLNLPLLEDESCASTNWQIEFKPFVRNGKR